MVSKERSCSVSLMVVWTREHAGQGKITFETVILFSSIFCLPFVFVDSSFQVLIEYLDLESKIRYLLAGSFNVHFLIYLILYIMSVTYCYFNACWWLFFGPFFCISCWFLMFRI